MERLLNQYDKEYMKMAMLKHEETFREQVYELHRLYRIQKMLMKDMAKNARMDRSSRSSYNGPESKVERAVGSVPEMENGDLELTLGPRSFYEKKVKGGINNRWDNSGGSFSSSSTGSSHRSPWGPETPAPNQDRLNSPPWLFQALSLNMT